MPKAKKSAKPKSNKPAKAAVKVIRRAAMPTSSASGLSKCSDDYMKSLMEPWGPEAPCLPSGFPIPSLKRKFFARGTFGQGTLAGFVLFNPLDGVKNDSNSIFYSDGNYTGNVFASSGTGVLLANTNSSYSTTSFGATSLQARVVSAGIRVRYDGTELNRGGRIIPIEHPQHNSLLTYDPTEVLSMQGVQPVRPSSDGKWVTVVNSGPKGTGELGYGTTPSGGLPYLGIIVNGGVGPTGTSPSATANFVLEWECWANYEVIGTLLSGQTISHHDPVGASLAATAVSTAQMQAPHSNSPGFKTSVSSLVGRYGREAVTTGAHFLWQNRGTIAKGAMDLAALL